MARRFQFSLAALFIFTGACAVLTVIGLAIGRSPASDFIIRAMLFSTLALAAISWYFYSYVQLTETVWSSLRIIDTVFFLGGLFLGIPLALVFGGATLVALLHI
jgi:hypothetical protein